MKSITYLDLAAIVPNPKNPRKTFKKEDLNELSISIKQIGVLQPVTVRPIKEGYELVCGERRYRACKLLGLETIPAIIRKLTNDEAMDIMITENLQREDIDPFEEADAFMYLQSKKNKPDEIAARFGKSLSYIYNRIKLVDLVPELRTLYADGEVKVTHCLEIAKYPIDVQTEIFKDFYEKDDYRSLRKDSLLRVQSIITSNYSLNLKDAPFDTKGCEGCNHNTGASNLFPELKETRCLDKECFSLKKLRVKADQIIEKSKIYPDYKIIYIGSGDHPLFSLLGDLERIGIAENDWHYIDLENVDQLMDYLNNGYSVGYHIGSDHDVVYKRNENNAGDGTVNESSGLTSKIFTEQRQVVQDIRELLKSYFEEMPIADIGKPEDTDMDKNLLLFLLAVRVFSIRNKFELDHAYSDDTRASNFEKIKNLEEAEKRSMIRLYIIEDFSCSSEYLQEQLVEWLSGTFPELAEKVSELRSKSEAEIKVLQDKVDALNT